jgi:cell division protein ZapA
MAQVQVTIGGRPYRLACGEGEEPHLMALARMVDGKIAELRGSFGEIGDQRITVMAALTVADELSEAQRRVAALEAEIAGLRRSGDGASAEHAALTDRVAEALADAARRIERVAQGLNGRG